VNYPGAKTRQLSLRPEQLPRVRKALNNYRQAKETLEKISEINQQLLRLERDELKEPEA
jgi:response regulator of citrate/malate metabolism